jgi:hypothetical protein
MCQNKKKPESVKYVVCRMRVVDVRIMTTVRCTLCRMTAW